jgi:hypothetical protein
VTGTDNLWSKENIEVTLPELHEQQPTIKFVTEKELHSSINFLDLSVRRREKELEFAIHRKPSQTDNIIPKDSCNPHKHKLSSINYLVNRVNIYQISNEAKEKEINITDPHSFINSFRQWLYSPLLGPGLFFNFIIFLHRW